MSYISEVTKYQGVRSDHGRQYIDTNKRTAPTSIDNEGRLVLSHAHSREASGIIRKGLLRTLYH